MSDNSYWARLTRRLAAIGYQADVPPLPLIWQAAHDIAGFSLSAAATADAPLDLGLAEIVAVEEKRHGLVVVRVSGHGDYYGSLKHNLFFAGPDIDTKGHLYFAHNFCVLCSEQCSIAQAIEVMHKIPLERNTIS